MGRTMWVLLFVGVAGCGSVKGDELPGDGPVAEDSSTDAPPDAAPPTTIGAFTQSGTFPLARAGHASVVAAGRLYIVAGNLCSTCGTQGVDAGGNTGNVVSAPIGIDGAIGTFRTESSLVTVRQLARVFTARRNNKDFLYVVGGANSTGSMNTDVFPTSVERAEITDSGLSAFTTVSSLTVGRAAPGLLVRGDDVFVLGGSTGGANGFVSSIEHAVIDANGGLGPFSVLSQTLAIESSAHAVAASGDRVLLLGGSTDNSISIADVQVGQLAGAQFAGNFTAVPPATSTLAAPRTGGLALILGDRVFVFGGGNGQTVVAFSATEVASIDPVGAFGPGPTALDQPRYLPSDNVIGGRYCIMGGTTTATLDPTRYLASIICAPLE